MEKQKMASVFGADTGKPVVLKAGKAIVTVNNQTLIALNVTCQFGRSVEVIPALSKKRIVSISEPQGNFSADTIISKASDPTQAFNVSGDDCSPYDMQIKFYGNACDAGGKTVTCKNCFTNSISVSAQGGRGFIGSGFSATFTALVM